MIEKAKEYAIDCHDMTAHQYDGKPYDTHLQMVFDTAKKFIHLIMSRSCHRLAANGLGLCEGRAIEKQMFKLSTNDK